MANLKKFKVADWADQFVLVLEVDLDKLTPALATEINNFWGGADDRLNEEGCDVVKAVIRLYGARVIGLMADCGGADYRAPASQTCVSTWDKDMQAEEGWPPADGTPGGMAGIRLLEATVEIPGFDDLELVEVTS